MKRVKIILLSAILSVAGLILPRSINAQTEIERLEQRIKSLEFLAAGCAERISSLKPPDSTASEEEWQKYEDALELYKKCAEQIEIAIRIARKLLDDILSKLPAASTPGEDPETKRRHEEIRAKVKEWEKRVAESEKKKNEILARLADLQKKRRK